MRVTAIRSDKIYKKMISAKPEERDDIIKETEGFCKLPITFLFIETDNQREEHLLFYFHLKSYNDFSLLQVICKKVLAV